MVQTQALETIALYLTKAGLTAELISVHLHGLRWNHFLTIPGLLLGWSNSLAMKAISETIGINATNAAIFGNNTCSVI